MISPNRRRLKSEESGPCHIHVPLRHTLQITLLRLRSCAFTQMKPISQFGDEYRVTLLAIEWLKEVRRKYDSKINPDFNHFEFFHGTPSKAINTTNAMVHVSFQFFKQKSTPYADC